MFINPELMQSALFSAFRAYIGHIPGFEAGNLRKTYAKHETNRDLGTFIHLNIPNDPNREQRKRAINDRAGNGIQVASRDGMISWCAVLSLGPYIPELIDWVTLEESDEEANYCSGDVENGHKVDDVSMNLLECEV